MFVTFILGKIKAIQINLNNNKTGLSLHLMENLLTIHSYTKSTHHRTNLLKRKHCLHHFCDLNERTIM